MSKEPLLEWIEERLHEGYTPELIKKYLTSQGHSHRLVDLVQQNATKVEKTSSEKPHPSVLAWVEESLAKGYSKKVIKHYLLKHGHDPRVVDSFEEKKVAPDTVVTVTERDFFESTSPTQANEFFKTFYRLSVHPDLFFSQIYERKQLAGLRMLGFSMLCSLTLGTIFWFLFYFFNLYFHMPWWTYGYVSIHVTAHFIIAFTLILLFAHPFYYIVAKWRHKDLRYKQFISAIAYAFSPFFVFATLPVVQILGVFLSLRLFDRAAKVYLRVDKRTRFDIRMIYAIGTALVSLGLILLVTVSAPTIDDHCVLFPQGVCTVYLSGTNQLAIVGDVPDEPIFIYNVHQQQVCQGDSAQSITCARNTIPGAYYFRAGNVTGSFVLR